MAVARGAGGGRIETRGSDMSIDVRNISKTFGRFVALNDVSLTVPDGELVALLGPSGSGKTTLLRIIAGLEVPNAGAGQVLFNGQDVTGHSPAARGIGFVFQHYSLFRHMTIFENIAFGLRVRPRPSRPNNAEIRDRVAKLLELVQLESLRDRYPWQLSGGQRQRVALVRALAVEPKVLLLDEPFGALDAKVRKELRRWLRRLHDETAVTSVFVTHDQEEALEVADRIAVMNHGQIEQVGTPEAVYEHPANPFVYNFLGSVNLFHGRVQNGRLQIGQMELGHAVGTVDNDGPAVAYVRPHDLEIERTPQNRSSIPARVRHINSAGPIVRVQLELPDTGQNVEAELTRDRYRELALLCDEQVYVVLRNARVFAQDYSI
jgi:sulfate transport system ATP-binding protein